MRTLLAASCALALSLAGLCSCGGEKKPVTITWWHTTLNDGSEAAWKEMADAFSKANPHVTFAINEMPGDSLREKIMAAIESGEPPDLFRVWGSIPAGSIAKAGQVKDLTRELQGTAWGKTFSPGALEAFSYQGRNFGVPFYMGGVALWYNKAIFTKLGLKPFETWSGLIEGVKKMKAAGITPIALGEYDRWTGQFWWSYLALRIGGKAAFQSAVNGPGSFRDPAFVKAGEKLQELVSLSPFQPGFERASYTDEVSFMANGGAGMELMGQWTIQLQRESPNGGLRDDLGIMAFPMVEGGAGNPADLLGGGEAYYVGKKAPAETVQFLKFITEPGNYGRLLAFQQNISVVRGGERGMSDPALAACSDLAMRAPYIQTYPDQIVSPPTAGAISYAAYALFLGMMAPADAADLIQNVREGKSVSMPELLAEEEQPPEEDEYSEGEYMEEGPEYAYEEGGEEYSEADTGESVKKALTWTKISHIDALGVDLVGVESGDPYSGDTPITEALPILAVKIDDLPRPRYEVTGADRSMPREYYQSWLGGYIALTPPVQGTLLTSLEAANELCRKYCGAGFRMAEFHDGRYIAGMGLNAYYGDTWPPMAKTEKGGWNFYAYGNVKSDTRFWVYIEDQPANCWD